MILRTNYLLMQKIIVVSGYFNPIHKGHLEYFIKAKAQGDLLFVIVNSDHQRVLKGSKEFQNEDERLFIVQHIKEVDQAFLSIDLDRTVCETLKFLHRKFGNTYCLAFANGGDQTNQSIPETPICQALGIELIDGLGDKIQSSSWLLKM
jgi:cytidyltransferase-like protein